MSSKYRSTLHEPLFCEVKNNETEQSEDSTLPVGRTTAAMDTLIHQHLHESVAYKRAVEVSEAK